MLALVSLSSIVLLASVAFAQTTGSTHENNEKARGEWQVRRGGHRGFGKSHMGGGGFRNLNLTDDQKARMKQIRESFGERTKSLREQLRAKHRELRQAQQGGTFNEALATQVLSQEAALKAKMMGEQFKLRQEMLAVLTAEQRTQLEQQREERKARRGEFRGRRGTQAPQVN